MESCCLKPLRFSKVVRYGAKTNQQMEPLKTIKLNQIKMAALMLQQSSILKYPSSSLPQTSPPPFLDRRFRNWVQP